MTTFAGHMATCRRTKQAARNRGQSTGDYRGTLAPRSIEQLPDDWMERAFATIAQSLAYTQREESAQLSWLIAVNNDATIAEIPF